MTKSRNGEILSQSTKTYLKHTWIRQTYNRDADYKTITPATQKGIMVETDSLELLKKVTGENYFKNITNLENDFIKGTPDVKTPLIDIKSSWDLFTFAMVDEETAKKDYFYQLLGYGWLIGVKKADIVFALVNTPEQLIADALYRLSFKIPDEDEVEKYRVNFVFDDIEAEKRIKRYTFEFTDAIIKELKEKIIAARQYMNELSL